MENTKEFCRYWPGSYADDHQGNMTHETIHVANRLKKKTRIIQSFIKKSKKNFQRKKKHVQTQPTYCNHAAEGRQQIWPQEKV